MERGGVLAAVAKMALGNGIGAQLFGDMEDLTQKAYGDIVIEGEGLDFEVIGKTGGEVIGLNGEAVALSMRCAKRTNQPLARVYPLRSVAEGHRAGSAV